MARPREFDENEVLDRAMLQFWQHGFEGTSIHDLVDRTRLGRQSLYNAFGDKRAIFLRALQRYDDKTNAMLAPMLRPDADLQTVRDYVEGAIALQKEHRCRGCLVTRSALELGSADPDIRNAVARTGRRVRKAIANALAGAADAGEARRDQSPTELADYVFATLNGLASLAGTGAGEKQARRVVDLMFASLAAAT